MSQRGSTANRLSTSSAAADCPSRIVMCGIRRVLMVRRPSKSAMSSRSSACCCAVKFSAGKPYFLACAKYSRAAGDKPRRFPAELLKRLRKPVRQLHVPPLELLEQLDVVIAGNAEGGSGRDHPHD